MKLLDFGLEEAEEAEVYQIKAQATPVKFSSGELDSAKSVETRGQALRLVSEGRLGYATATTDGDRETERDKELVQKALEASRFGDRAPFQFPAPQAMEQIRTRDRELVDLSPAELIEMGEELIGSLEEFDPDLQVDVNLSKSLSQVRIANSNGLDLEEERTSLGITLSVQQVRGEDIFSFYLSSSGKELDWVEPSALLEQALTRLRWAEKTTQVGRGPNSVLFTPQGSLVLLFPLLSGFNGKNVYLGSSPLEGRLNEQVLDSRFNLVDDGRVEGAGGSCSFDDEGIPTRRKEIFSAGVLKNFLYDLRTSALCSAEPTGNGFKGGMLGDDGFRSLPSTGPSNLIIEGGERSFEGLLAEIESGILVDGVLGLGQGNPSSGQFSNNVSVAYKVENGEIVGRIKNTMIAGNVYELLEDGLIGLGSEAEWVGGSLKVPPIAVDGVNVVGEG